MRKIFAILMALCIFTALVSSASAYCNQRTGVGCTDAQDPVRVKVSYTPVNSFTYTSDAHAEGGVDAISEPIYGYCGNIVGYTCPTGSWQAGTTPTTGGGSLAYGSASTAGGASAGSAGSSDTSVEGSSN